MAIIDHGQIADRGSRGWVLGHMAIGPWASSELSVKWMEHPPGLAGDGSWSICRDPRTKTLAVLIEGHFRIHFRESSGSEETVIDLTETGDFVLFDPPTQHWSEALVKSTFLTIRWPSTRDDCGSIAKEPWASHSALLR